VCVCDLQSPVLTAHPLTSLAVDPSYLRVAVGAVDGCVRVYDLASLPACRLLQVGQSVSQWRAAEQPLMRCMLAEQNSAGSPPFASSMQVVDVTKQLQGIAAAAAAETGAEGAAGVAGSAGVPGRQSGAGQGRARPGEGPRVITARPTPGAPPQAGRVVPAPRLGAPSPAQEVSVPQVVLLSASILQLYYSPLRSPGADGLLGESPKLLVGGWVGGWVGVVLGGTTWPQHPRFVWCVCVVLPRPQLCRALRMYVGGDDGGPGRGGRPHV
jgi:hypothetical protein